MISGIFSTTFSSLRHRNFRLFLFGQCISLIGTWMQTIAQPWLVYSITKSAFLLGVVSTLQFLPMLLFSLFAGVLVDKFSRRTILLYTQSFLAFMALILAILTWNGHVRYWHVIVIAVMSGTATTVYMPARQSFMIDIASREDLMNAIALNSTIVNLAKILGPALAGLIMAYAGIAVCFFLNAVSYLAVIAGLLMMDIKAVERKTHKGRNVLKDIGDGIAHVFQNEYLFSTITLSAVIGIFAMNHRVLLPIFTESVLHMDEKAYGLLMSATGAGSLVAALTMAAQSNSGPKTSILFISPMLVALLLIITGFSPNFVIALIILAITGYFTMSFNNMASSMMQLNVKEEYRGRVTSVYTLLHNGTIPIGSFYTGVVTGWFGGRAGFIACGAAAVLLTAAIYLYLKNMTRHKGMDLNATYDDEL